MLLQDFGEHGREYITSEVGLRMFQTLTNATELTRLLKSQDRVARLQSILSKTFMKVGLQRSLEFKTALTAAKI
jgi:hypothetical protein